MKGFKVLTNDVVRGIKLKCYSNQTNSNSTTQDMHARKSLYGILLNNEFMKNCYWKKEDEISLIIISKIIKFNK